MVEMNDIGRYVLLASCPLQKGIAARLTQFVYDMGSEIVDYDQYVDIANHYFFCRMEWGTPSRSMQHDEVLKRFQAEVAVPFDLSWGLRLNDRPPGCICHARVSTPLHAHHEMHFRPMECQHRINHQ